MTTAEHTNPPKPRDAGREPEAPLIQAFLRRQGGQWHATAIDYSIVGSGSTQDEALTTLREMVNDYLASCARDGVSPDEARRPIPPRWTFSLVADLLSDALRLALHRSSSRGGRVFVPRHGL